MKGSGRNEAVRKQKSIRLHDLGNRSRAETVNEQQRSILKVLHRRQDQMTCLERIHVQRTYMWFEDPRNIGTQCPNECSIPLALSGVSEDRARASFSAVYLKVP